MGDDIISSQIIRKEEVELQLKDRADSTLARNNTQTTKFIRFIKYHLRISDGDDRIKLLNKLKYIPVELCIDDILSKFITHELIWHRNKGNQIHPNLRHTHGYIQYSINKNGLNQNNYNAVNSTWGGIRQTPEYRLHRAEQALVHKLDDHVIITKMNIYKSNGQIDIYLLRMRHCYDMNYHSSLRTDNIHNLLDYQVQKTEDDKPVIYITTEQTKTSNKQEYHGISCCCEENKHHNSYSICPITIYDLYVWHKEKDTKYVQKKYLLKNGKPLIINPSELWYWRRICWVSSRKKDEKYFTMQRWGEKNIRKNFKEICDLNNIKPPQNKNKRRKTFTCLVFIDFICIYICYFKLFIFNIGYLTDI